MYFTPTLFAALITSAAAYSYLPCLTCNASARGELLVGPFPIPPKASNSNTTYPVPILPILPKSVDTNTTRHILPILPILPRSIDTNTTRHIHILPILPKSVNTNTTTKNHVKGLDNGDHSPRAASTIKVTPRRLAMFRPFLGTQIHAVSQTVADTQTAAVTATVPAPDPAKRRSAAEEENKPAVEPAAVTWMTDLGYAAASIPTITPTWTAVYRPFHGPFRRPTPPTAVAAVSVLGKVAAVPGVVLVTITAVPKVTASAFRA